MGKARFKLTPGEAPIFFKNQIETKGSLLKKRTKQHSFTRQGSL